MFFTLLVFHFFSLPELSLRVNWVDLVILIVLFYFVIVGWTVGFWATLADFLSFFLSLLIALRVYPFIAAILRSNFEISNSFANALGFLIAAVSVEVILSLIFAKIIRKVPLKLWKKWWSRFLGVFPAVAEALIIISFVLLFLIALPISPSIKSDLTKSKLGWVLVQKTTGVEAKINEIFGGVIEDSLTYLTSRPGSTESIPITAEIGELRIDEQEEIAMFNLVNKERKERGIKELVSRDDTVRVARRHAEDMWKRSYFGHVSPEGKDLGQRLAEEEVRFFLAGENLALSPTLITAHTGLMNSPGHRENILDERFKRMGIGVIDNGVYGKMFVQVFTD